MADHGESLGAHGEEQHGIFLYDETIRVPLLIKMPQSAAAGKRVESPVELADIMPTFLKEAGIAIPREVQGKSLLELINDGDGASRGNRSAYSQSLYQHTIFGWAALRSLRTEKYLFIQAPRRELYDQAADPSAEHNLELSSSAVAETLASQLESVRQKTSSQREAIKSTLTDAAQQQLGALGYMASGRDASRNTPEDQGADPKDKIWIANAVQRAQTLQEDTHPDEAIVILQGVIAKEPGLPFLSIWLGDWLLKERRFQEAIPPLRKAMEADRDNYMPHLQLAKAYLGAKDYTNAIPEFEIVEAKMPSLAEVHFLLQMAYTQTNRVQDVLRECNIILQFAPDHYATYLIMGHFLEVAGDLDGAISTLKKASSLEPKAPAPHVLLSEVYDHMERKADAARERAIAQRLGAKEQ
jgi:tetratricopeptide (TPR) repeat protein